MKRPNRHFRFRIAAASAALVASVALLLPLACSDSSSGPDGKTANPASSGSGRLISKSPPSGPADPKSPAQPAPAKTDAVPNPGGPSFPPPVSLAVSGLSGIPADHLVRFDSGITAVINEPDERVEAECAMISGQSRPLEFLIVTEGGSAHEALLQLTGRAYYLKQAMELIGLKEGTKKLAYRGDPTMPDGAPISLSVRWRDRTGAIRENPIEDWVLNGLTKTAMERGPWVFTGSVTRFREDLNQDVFYADEVGNVVAIWRDPSCVIDNPRTSATDDKVWATNTRASMPTAGSRVVLIVRPVKK
jgi:hypothetical protein